MAYCTQCGALLPDVGRFCTQCGAAFETGSAVLAYDDSKTSVMKPNGSEAQVTSVEHPDADPAPAAQDDLQSALTVMMPSKDGNQQATDYPETSGIDQFVMDMPQAAVFYPAPEQPTNMGYAPQPSYQQQVYAAPAPPQQQVCSAPAVTVSTPPQEKSRWPFVVIIVSVAVIIAAGAFAVWWFLLR